MEVTVGINYDEEMLSIERDGVSIFYGNFWDFERPGDIIKLLGALDIEFKAKKLRSIG